MQIAIDFGTSNTVVARWDPVSQRPEALILPGLSQQQVPNYSLIPSLVYFEDSPSSRVLVGQQVRDRALHQGQDPRLFANFKRAIGKPSLGFVPSLNGESLTFEAVGSCFLTQVVQAVRSLPLPVDSIIFTVPVDSFEVYRHWLGRLSQTLGVDRVQLIDEPTAAALGHGIGNRETLLVMDWGGGTLDLSLVKLHVGSTQKPQGFILKWGDRFLGDRPAQKVKTAQVLAKTGQDLGGADIDHWLLDYLCQTRGLQVSPLIARLVERLKIQLSSAPRAQEVFFCDRTFTSVDLSLTRGELEQVLTEHQLWQSLETSLNQVLHQARRQGIEPGDIDGVLLVGGTVQIPAIQAWIKDYFPSLPVYGQAPLTAVALGALHLNQGIQVQDFLHHSYGIRYWDHRRQTQGWHPLIQAGQAYPMSQPLDLFLGASAENQSSLELVVAELGSQTSAPEVYLEGGRLVTRPSQGLQVQPLNDQARTIANLDPPGFPGTDRVKVSFWVDAQRQLRVTVLDLLRGEILVENQALVELT